MIPGAGSRRRGRALYVCPHQDDEQLTYGAAIVADVKAGYDVTVLLVTDGSGAPARTDPVLASRVGSTPNLEAFSNARTREFVESVRRMGATPVTPPYGTLLVDGSSTPTSVRALIEEYYEPGAVLRGTSQYDYHVDHRAVGDALIALEADGFGTDLRLMFSSFSIDLLTGNGIPAWLTINRVDNNPFPLYYQWPYRHVDVPNGWWGVGYLDVPDIFDVITGPDPDTYWHRSPNG